MLRLSVEEKARLLDFSSGVVTWKLIPIVVLILGFSGFMHWKPSIVHMKWGLFIYLLLLLGSSALSSFIIQKKYRKLGFPESYIRSSLICSVLVLLLMIGFFAWMMLPIWNIPVK